MSTEGRTHASAHVAALSLSAIKDMAMRAARMGDVSSLSWGLPSFQTPAHIRMALEMALREDTECGKYSLPDGLPQLREAIVEAHASATGVVVSASDNVIVTAGNMEGVRVLLETLLDPGDEVIVTDPGFASHHQQICLAGGVPVHLRLDEARGWALDIAKVEALVTEKTRAILIVTPSNPTGTVFSRSELTHLGWIARRHGLVIILDDPYSHFLFDEDAHFYNLSCDETLQDHLAYLFTFSKCHAMSGWRLGYAILPGELKHQMLKVHDATLICAPRPSQIAGLAALRGGLEHVGAFRHLLEERRNLICARLDRLRHVFSYVRPKGAYYVFPRIERGEMTSHDFAIDLLEHARVCVTPGAAFGPTGERHVRMAFCVDEDEINRAFDRLDAYFPA